MLFPSMRTRVGTVVAMAMVLGACSKPGDGPRAQAFSLETLGGSTLSVDPAVDHRGKILVFWASW